MRTTFFKYLNLYFIFGCFFSLQGLEEKPVHTTLKTSIIVPCHYLHFYLIPELLSFYENQTVLPDEVVISLSECDKVQDKAIAKVEERKYPFKLKIIKSPGIQYGGQNRNVASEHSSGDILICQDADDVPHPQRVELIKFLFEKYQIDHLMHRFILSDKKFSYCHSEKAVTLTHYYPDASVACNNPLNHNGNVAIARYVFDKVKWPEHDKVGEDLEFNAAVYSHFKKTVILPFPLLLYRNNLGVY